jgi:phosphoglycolate phosphatase-like HAD superfamily hydrolase
MTDKKVLVFDMDGTIADFYGVNGWLDDLNNHCTRPYEIAKPLYNMVELAKILEDLKKIGYVIAITTWLSANSTKEYDDRVRKAKLEWLKKYSFPYDEIHLVKYGTTKANCTRKLGGFQILVDDNEKVRKGWNLGATINANEDIIEKLKELL